MFTLPLQCAGSVADGGGGVKGHRQEEEMEGNMDKENSCACKNCIVYEQIMMGLSAVITAVEFLMLEKGIATQDEINAANKMARSIQGDLMQDKKRRFQESFDRERWEQNTHAQCGCGSHPVSNDCSPFPGGCSSQTGTASSCISRQKDWERVLSSLERLCGRLRCEDE